jgi:spoIIIJ-associated protein
MNQQELHQIREFINSIFRMIAFRISSTVLERGDALLINISGEDRAYLIADQGETILSWQYLLAKMIRQQNASANDLHIIVDSDGFMQRHDEEVRRLAQRTMQRVRRERRRIKLPPMSPYDRRIVHTEVGRDADLDTFSEGEGFFKYIVVQRRRY